MNHNMEELTEDSAPIEAIPDTNDDMDGTNHKSTAVSTTFVPVDSSKTLLMLPCHAHLDAAESPAIQDVSIVSTTAKPAENDELSGDYLVSRIMCLVYAEDRDR
jgi:hypothetical protein